MTTKTKQTKKARRAKERDDWHEGNLGGVHWAARIAVGALLERLNDEAATYGEIWSALEPTYSILGLFKGLAFQVSRRNT